MSKILGSLKKSLFGSKQQHKYKEYAHTQLKLIAMRSRMFMEENYKKTCAKITDADSNFKYIQQQSPHDDQRKYEMLQEIGEKVIEAESIKIYIQILRKIEAYSPQIIKCHGDISHMKQQLKWFQCILWYRKCKDIKNLDELFDFCFNFFKGVDITMELHIKCEIFQIYPILKYLADGVVVPVELVMEEIKHYVSFAISQQDLEEIYRINRDEIKKWSKEEKDERKKKSLSPHEKHIVRSRSITPPHRKKLSASTNANLYGQVMGDSELGGDQSPQDMNSKGMSYTNSRENSQSDENGQKINNNNNNYPQNFSKVNSYSFSDGGSNNTNNVKDVSVPTPVSKPENESNSQSNSNTSPSKKKQGFNNLSGFFKKSSTTSDSGIGEVSESQSLKSEKNIINADNQQMMQLQMKAQEEKASEFYFDSFQDQQPSMKKTIPDFVGQKEERGNRSNRHMHMHGKQPNTVSFGETPADDSAHQHQIVSANSVSNNKKVGVGFNRLFSTMSKTSQQEDNASRQEDNSATVKKQEESGSKIQSEMLCQDEIDSLGYIQEALAAESNSHKDTFDDSLSKDKNATETQEQGQREGEASLGGQQQDVQVASEADKKKAGIKKPYMVSIYARQEFVDMIKKRQRLMESQEEEESKEK